MVEMKFTRSPSSGKNTFTSAEEVLTLLEGSPDALCEWCLERALRIGQGYFDCGGIYVFDRESGSFTLRASAGVSEAFSREVRSLRSDAGLGIWGASGQTLYGMCEELPLEKPRSFLREGLRRMLVVPLTFEGKTVGRFEMASRVGEECPPDVLARTVAFARRLGPVIFRKCREGQKEDLAREVLNLLDGMDDFLFVLGEDGQVLWGNRRVCEKLGYSMDELSRMSFVSLHPRERREEAGIVFLDMLRGGRTSSCIPFMARGGDLIPVETIGTSATWRGRPVFCAVSRDMTNLHGLRMTGQDEVLGVAVREGKRKVVNRIDFERLISAAARELLQSDDFDRAFEKVMCMVGNFTGADRVCLLSLDERARAGDRREWCSSRAEAFRPGFARKASPESFLWVRERLEEEGALIVGDVEELPEEASLLKALLKSKNVHSKAFISVHIDGRMVGFIGVNNFPETTFVGKEDVALLNLLGEVVGAAMRRKTQDEALRKREEDLHTILKDTEVLICRLDGNRRVTFVNEAICSFLGLGEEEMCGKDCVDYMPEEKAGRAKLLLDSLSEDRPVQELQRFHSRADGQSRWLRWTVRAFFDGEGRKREYQLTAVDVTEQKQVEKQLEKSFYALSRSFHSTVMSMAKMVETRDPYTAGHQQRVAVLARRIALDLGLSGSRVQTVYYGALLHDIGKMYIPGEILNRPGRLTELEMSLIQGHASRGGDILREIYSPWQFDRIAEEHHERLDGSGYPAGLKGDEICLESRIVAVADVVEAMSSHRPYRPALGIDEALKEIRAHSGSKYDPQVVLICLELFEKREFSFEREMEQENLDACIADSLRPFRMDDSTDPSGC